jgi:hypothetical protein
MGLENKWSEKTKSFYEKVYPCTDPCDSYGVCEGCVEGSDFKCGYEQGSKDAIDEVFNLLRGNEAHIQFTEKHYVYVADWLEEKLKNE